MAKGNGPTNQFEVRSSLIVLHGESGIELLRTEPAQDGRIKLFIRIPRIEEYVGIYIDAV